MTQSRLGSLYESIINVVIGFVISFAANAVILPAMGFEISVTQNLVIGLAYTVISIVRSYCVRRWFNARIATAANRLAGD